MTTQHAPARLADSWRRANAMCASIVGIAFFFGVFVARAQQQPQPTTGRTTLASVEVALGRSRARTRIVVRSTEAGAAELEIAGQGAATPIAPRGVPIRWAVVRDVEIARGAHAAVVFASSEAPTGGARAIPERGWVGVIGLAAEGGAPAVVFQGPLALEGDIGERTAAAITIGDMTSDGFDDVVVGQRVEGARLCGATRLPVMDPSALDPATLRMRRVELSPLRDLAGAEEGITARDASPGPTGAPVARIATWESASSSARVAAGSFRRPPVELGDGRRETAFVFARARFDHATARITPGAGAIRAIALDLTAADPTTARRYRRARTLWLVGDSGPRLRVTIPGDALLRSDGRYWVVPPRPLAWSCMSIVIGDTYGDDAALSAAIADVAIYTELDYGQGLDTLAAALEEARHSAAAETLARGGMRGADAVIARWPRMGERGRLRALEVLTRIAEAARGASDETAVRARVSTHLVTAFDDPSPAVAARTYEILGNLDAPAIALMTSSLAGTDETRALRALDVLSQSSSDAAHPLLVGALADAREPVRVAAARAIGRYSVRRMSPRGGGSGPAALASVGALIDAIAADTRLAPDVIARVIVEMSRLAVLGDPIARAIAATWPRVTTFADRYRLIRAAARTVGAAQSREVLVAAATGSGDEWPLRALAVSALGGAPDAATYATLLTGRLSDRAVRVREAAVRALGPHAFAEDAVVRAIESDRWPLVRAAAVEAVARPEAGPRARAAIARAVDDRSWTVRATAIRSLGPTGVHDADARVLRRLRDARETAEVRRAAIDLIEARCWTSARATLLAALRERPETLSDEWVSFGVAAWRALSRLGPSPELREAEGFGRGLPAAIQREVRRVRPCAPRPGSSGATPARS